MVDREEMARKYAEERAKRIRKDGTAQYVPIEIGSDFEADPFVDSVAEREPVTVDTEVAIIGAGWSGQLTAVQLRKEGIDDFLVVDKAADFGGTWYWNRYPGLACDCESYVYMPMLEEMGYMPSARYAPGEEIWEYSKSIARRFNLYENSLLQTLVTSLNWDEETLRWIVSTNRGDNIRARFMVLGTGGVLHRPKLPGIPGLETFSGHSFHSSRWDYRYTGGDSRGNLTKLADKRVAVIGTGPTALQCFPLVAESAKETYLVQRTPVIVGVRANDSTDPEWYENQESGWQRRRADNFEAQMFGMPVEEKIVTDGWTEIWGLPVLEMPTDGSPPDLEAYQAKLADYDIEQMERIRTRVDELIDDPEVAEKLKPWYATHCKRPSFHDNYLQAFNKPNVHLLDTDGCGPERITPNGLVVDGKEYPVDLIVYATGFESVVSPARSGGFDVIGAGGVTLDQAWKERVRTVHGIYTHGFPNMYVVGGVRQSAVSVNVLHVAGEQAAHVAKHIKQLTADQVVRFEVTAEAVQQWCATMDENMHLVFNAEQVKLCTPGYFNNEGDFDTEGKFEHGRPVWADAYYGGPFTYRDLLDRWRDDREYEGAATIVHSRDSVTT
ncbi:NAD(P)/FAD-dependent oxidoreductase [Mycobacterium sp. URHB0044]|jgi:cyclohexanone monooxygenase|uniref:flavin-containing monooxygenase n=1 Tax=Mycobacterium sp. URHB0044 TaxID=1380386 RepID=UPI0007E8CBE9|nr:NAD(P)/FAD-dependent oxidoreductase [Mycobacterium sp. URHB0044]